MGLTSSLYGVVCIVAIALVPSCSSNGTEVVDAGRGDAENDSIAEALSPGGDAIDGTAEADSLELDSAREDGGAPGLLSETGLYANLAQGETLAVGVEPYHPSFELWSDGAEKRRWLYLPPGSRIDTSDEDVWIYPVGARVWKEFRRDGVRVETRFIEKRGPASWVFMAYHWNAGQTDATAVPKGLADASGTGHDIPSQVDCGICHNNVPDRLLGVTALQLSQQGDGLTLQKLANDGRLSDPPAASFVLPGDETTRAALGYLHANCGICHNPRSTVFATVKLQLWLPTAQLDAVERTPTYRTTVGVPFEGTPPAADIPAIRIVPGSPENSAVYHRMSRREPNVQMPPIATELPDAAGLSAVGDWIQSLAPASNDP